MTQKGLIRRKTNQQTNQAFFICKYQEKGIQKKKLYDFFRDIKLKLRIQNINFNFLVQASVQFRNT